MSVQRYQLATELHTGFSKIKSAAAGQYVKHNDYAALAREVADLQELSRGKNIALEAAEQERDALKGQRLMDNAPTEKARAEAAEQRCAELEKLLDEVRFLCDGEDDITNSGGPNLAMKIHTAIGYLK